MTNADIQVGEYVRTCQGYIAKLDGILGVEKSNVKSHSFNIIDLIEVGDYVNGEQVIQKDDDGIYIGLPEDYGWIGEIFIDTIVTHEQMKAMEYKVGGKND